MRGLESSETKEKDKDEERQEVGRDSGKDRSGWSLRNKTCILIASPLAIQINK